MKPPAKKYEPVIYKGEPGFMRSGEPATEDARRRQESRRRAWRVETLLKKL